MIALGVVGLLVSVFLLIRYAFIVRDVLQDRVDQIYFEFAIIGLSIGSIIAVLSLGLIWHIN